jgi:S-adenosylmethionine synthetase
VQLALSYAIGVAKPVSVFIKTYGTGKFADEDLQKAVENVFDLRPLAIITKLNLKQPIYSQTSAYGHFGKPNLAWEQTDMTEALQKEAKKYM